MITGFVSAYGFFVCEVVLWGKRLQGEVFTATGSNLLTSTLVNLIPPAGES